jgi:predicted nuclease of predicted toxin-antitoxin system
LKLLFDANLSPKLVRRLSELFPGSTHVFETGMAKFTADEVIWEYAKANGFSIVTADSDFLDLADSHGAPPKIVLLENCNYKTQFVEELLRRHAVRISELERSTRQVLILRSTS